MNQVLELYMVMGEIPYYLKSVSPGLSAAQNISRICFQSEGLLLDEFERLFESLFENYDIHTALIRALAGHRFGMSRSQLLAKTPGISSGGTFGKRLVKLEEAGFIAAFIPYGRANKGTWYRVIDEYTLFYLRWIQPVRRKLKTQQESPNYWESKSQSQAWKSWGGYAFETVCMKHINQICLALDITSIARETGSWRYLPKNESKSGAQIDLLIDRADGIINICEIKFHNSPFTIDKAYAGTLKQKKEIFLTHTKTRKQLFLTMITVNGLKANEYSNQLIDQEITLKALY